MTNWVVDAGYREILNRVHQMTREKLAWEHYFFSGGSLREFSRTRDELQDKIDNLVGTISEDRVYQLIEGVGGKRREFRSDRLRRYYVTDRTNEEHNYRRSEWRLVVDAGYARAIGAGFLGVAYTLTVHRAVREACVSNRPVVVKFREGSEYERLEIQVPYIDCAGTPEDECYTRLRSRGDRTYWHPEYPFFPFIDAVVPCNAFRSGHTEPERVLASIHVTVRGRKPFKREYLKELNAAVDRNPNLRGIATRLLVVVRPDLAEFEWNAAPNPATTRVMVGCFDPAQLAVDTQHDLRPGDDTLVSEQ